MPSLSTLAHVATRTPGVKRLAKAVPLVEIVLAAEVAMLAGQHLRRLDAPERRRLGGLLRKAHGRASALPSGEQAELRTLVAKLEPRLFAGDALDKLSPLPLPKRLLYGGRDSAARRALAARRS